MSVAAMAGARLAAVLLATAFGFACSSSEGGSEGGRRALTFDAVDFVFRPALVEVSAGQVTLAFTNTGTVSHNLSIPTIPVDLDLKAAETKNVIFVLPSSAEPVEFFCKFHRDRGMAGTFRVR